MNITAFRNSIEEINKKLLASGSTYKYKEQGRNGYNAIDLYNGSKCIRNVDCNEPKTVLVDSMKGDYEYYLGKK